MKTIKTTIIMTVVLNISLMCCTLLTSSQALSQTSSFSQKTDLKQFWEQYQKTSPKEAKSLIADTKYYGTIVNSIPPGSKIAQTIGYEGEEHFPPYGRLFLRLGELRIWIILIQNKNKQWQLTLDEKPVLDQITKGWKQEKVGDFNFHTKNPLNQSQIADAKKLNAFKKDLEKQFKHKLNTIDYYMSEPGYDAVNVVGERSIGAGQARKGLIKAVGTTYQAHELVHVMLLDTIGSTIRFYDEGLSNSLGSETLIRNKSHCQMIQQDWQQFGSFRQLLSADGFQRYHNRNNTSYVISQLVFNHLLKETSLENILKMMQESADLESDRVKIFESSMGSIKKIDDQIKKTLTKSC